MLTETHEKKLESDPADKEASDLRSATPPLDVNSEQIISNSATTHGTSADSRTSSANSRACTRANGNNDPQRPSDNANSTVNEPLGNQKNNPVVEKSLKENVLNVIGQPLKENRKLAPPVHSTFASRWAEVLNLGLPKKERLELIKKYPIPENCLFLDPPKLNKEFKPSKDSTAKDPISTRDQRIVCKHEKLEACVAGMAKVKSILLARDKDEDLSLIEALSDSIRLTIDAMHDEVAIRRSLVIANANPAVKDTLIDIEPNEFLFGKNLSENLKQA